MIWVTEIVKAGVDTLMQYLSLHVMTCLVPAFFIAGAIVALLSKDAILKYFGAEAKKCGIGFSSNVKKDYCFDCEKKRGWWKWKTRNENLEFGRNISLYGL